MQPLKFVKSVLTVLGVCAPEAGISRRRRLMNGTVYTIITGMHFLNTLASLLYFVNHISVNYEGGIYALMASNIVFAEFWSLLTLYYFRNDLLDAFNTFENIERRCELNSRIGSIK